MTRAYNTATTQQNSGGAVAGVTAGKNAVLNSAFNVWQRGTSVAGAGGGAYTADRWFLYAGGQITVSRQATGDTTNLPNIQYCARVQRANASADATAFGFTQSFETINSIPFAGKTVTWSFYARKGANYSPTSSILSVFLQTGTGTDQNQPTGYTGQVTAISSSATLTTTWQRFTFTGTIAATATEIATQFWMSPSGTAGANDYYEVTGVQLEVGSVATPYAPYSATYQGELAACQRYYYQIGPGDAYAGFGVGGFHPASNSLMFVINTPVVMRTVPTFTTAGAFQTNGTGLTLTGLGFNTTYSNVASYNGQASCSGATTGAGSTIRNENSTTAKMMFSSEL